MNDKEHLEKIKKETEFNWFNYPKTGKFALVFNLKKDDFDWLVQRIENLESQLTELVGAVYEHANEGTELMEIAEKIDEME